MAIGPFATGVAKRIALVEEVTFGVSPVSGSKYIRRVSSDLTLNKDAYESQEILPSQQLRDARHGVRRPQGTFSGQLSPGSFNDFWQGLLRSNFATGAIMATVTLTLATTGTLTIASGFFAGGLKKEDVIRISGAGAPNAAINGINLRINGLTDTVITTRDLPTTGLTNGSLTGVTITVVGKKIIIPATGQIYKSYSIEHWFSDVAQSELFTGCRFGQTTISMPPTGLVTFNTQIVGQNQTLATTQQLTTPTGPTSSTSLAAVNGELSINNVDVGVVTGLTLSLVPAMEAPPIVGSNIVPAIFQGQLRVNGSFTALFTDQTIANLFLNETEIGLSVLLTSDNTTSASFMRMTLPRMKAMSNQKSDGPMSLVQSMNFTALENVADTASDLTTIVIQDALA